MNVPLPAAFEVRMRSQFGTRADLILQSLDSKPGISVLLNSRKSLPEEMLGSPVAWHSLGRLLDHRPGFALDPLWHAGAYYAQESSSMFVEHVLAEARVPRSGRILDLCAAPGGKSWVVAQYLNPEGLVVSNEIHPLRVQILRENIIKLGRANVAVTRNSPSEWEAAGPLFDAVLVDAPCSGEGMFRKDPEARSEWNAGLPAMCAARQRDILRSAAALIKPGGVLIYSTCTFAPEENEEMLRFACEEFGFEPVAIDAPSDWPLERVANNAFRFGPHVSPGEGFFIGVLHKGGDEPGLRRRKPIATLQCAARPNVWFPEDLLSNPMFFNVKSSNEIRACAEQHFETIEYLHARCRIIHFPFEAGEIKGRDFIPHHHSAMCAPLGAESIALSREESLQFLRKQDLRMDMPLGWNMVSFEDRVLGRVKHLGNRSNNHYPKEFRLRS